MLTVHREIDGGNTDRALRVMGDRSAGGECVRAALAGLCGVRGEKCRKQRGPQRYHNSIFRKFPVSSIAKTVFVPTTHNGAAVRPFVNEQFVGAAASGDCRYHATANWSSVPRTTAFGITR